MKVIIFRNVCIVKIVMVILGYKFVCEAIDIFLVELSLYIDHRIFQMLTNNAPFHKSHIFPCQSVFLVM